MIPYGERKAREAIILVHEDFADLGHVDIKTENYEFNCAYLYHSESFLRGNKAKIIIQPRLFINHLPANLSIVED